MAKAMNKSILTRRTMLGLGILAPASVAAAAFATPKSAPVDPGAAAAAAFTSEDGAPAFVFGKGRGLRASNDAGPAAFEFDVAAILRARRPNSDEEAAAANVEGYLIDVMEWFVPTPAEGLTLRPQVNVFSGAEAVDARLARQSNLLRARYVFARTLASAAGGLREVISADRGMGAKNVVEIRREAALSGRSMPGDARFWLWSGAKRSRYQDLPADFRAASEAALPGLKAQIARFLA